MTFTFTFTFTTRAAYFVERNAWRQAYAELSAKIRDNRSALKKAQKELSKVGAFSYKQPPEQQKISGAAWSILIKLDDARWGYKTQANDLLKARAASKVEAHRQANLNLIEHNKPNGDTITIRAEPST